MWWKYYETEFGIEERKNIFEVEGNGKNVKISIFTVLSVATKAKKSCSCHHHFADFIAVTTWTATGRSTVANSWLPSHHCTRCQCHWHCCHHGCISRSPLTFLFSFPPANCKFENISILLWWSCISHATAIFCCSPLVDCCLFDNFNIHLPWLAVAFCCHRFKVIGNATASVPQCHYPLPTASASVCTSFLHAFAIAVKVVIPIATN